MLLPSCTSLPPPFCQSPGPATASPTLLRAPKLFAHTHTHTCACGAGAPRILQGGCAWSTMVCGSGSQREPLPSVSPKSGVNDSAPDWQTAWSLNKVIVDICCGLPPDGLPVCRHTPVPTPPPPPPAPIQSGVVTGHCHPVRL